MSLHDEYKVDVPEGEHGDCRIERFTVDQDGSVMSVLSSGFGRSVPPGTYTRLMRGRSLGGTLVMSDTRDEIRDHISVIHRAKGHCLVNGLGIGMVLQAMARKEEVTKVTVIEINPDVIALVGPHYEQRFGDKIEIIEMSAFDYKPPKGIRYGVVWHDIWDHLCSDNLPEMHKLHRKYGRRTDWQGSWGRGLCERQKRQDSNHWR